MIFCLINLSKCQDLCLSRGSVKFYLGLHVVNIDFQPLGLKSDHKEGGGGNSGDRNKKFKSLHFHNINTSDISTNTIS